MELHNVKVFLILQLVLILVIQCFATTDSCGVNERNNPDNMCQRTCNACRDCGPCLCKSGYIRQALGETCIPEPDCRVLHFKWMKEAKHENKKDHFFNCSS